MSLSKLKNQRRLLTEKQRQSTEKADAKMQGLSDSIVDQLLRLL